MESVGSPEEEVKLNNPVPGCYLITSYSSSHYFWPQLPNTDAKISLVSKNADIESKKYGATVTFSWDKRGTYPYYAVDGIRDNITLKSLH